MIVHHENPWFKVIEQESYFRLENATPQVVVLPVLGGDVVLVKVRRPLFGMSLWELPAGAVEEGETCLDAAMRELQEETGVSARDLGRWHEEEPLAVMPNRMREKACVYRVELEEREWHRRLVHDGEIESVHRLRPHAVFDLVQSGSLFVTLPIAVLLRYFAQQGSR